MILIICAVLSVYIIFFVVTVTVNMLLYHAFLNDITTVLQSAEDEHESARHNAMNHRNCIFFSNAGML